MQITKGISLAFVGLVVILVWVSMMPLYKYPINTDPNYGYLTSIITLWLVMGPALIGIGLLLEIIERKSIALHQKQ